MIVEALVAASLAAQPIPAAQAFALPSARKCVSGRMLTFRLRPLAGDDWASATVRIDGTASITCPCSA